MYNGRTKGKLEHETSQQMGERYFYQRDGKMLGRVSYGSCGISAFGNSKNWTG